MHTSPGMACPHKSAGVNGVVGDELPGSSRLSSYVYGKYKFRVGAFAQGFFRIDYSYASKAYSDLNNATSLHYGNGGSVDAQLGARFDPVEVLLFGRKRLMRERSASSVIAISCSMSRGRQCSVRLPWRNGLRV